MEEFCKAQIHNFSSALGTSKIPALQFENNFLCNML